MPKRPQAEKVNGGEFGPGWSDVADMLRDLYRQAPGGVRCLLTPTRSVNGLWGIRVEVVSRADEKFLGACGYGRAYADGAKTMAAACIHAFIRAERELQSQGTPVVFQKPLELPWSDSE